MKERQRASHLLAALLILLPAAATAAGNPVATVQRVSGTLTVRRQGAAAFSPLAARGALYVGDVVGTGPNSRASLLFTDGSQLRLNADSAVEVLASASVGRGHEGLFRALTGEAWARLRPGKAAQTRSAIAGVRGTEFDLRVSVDGTTVLTVLDGTVDFYNEFGAVDVSESEQSTARPGAAPTAPVTIANPDLIIEWTLDLGYALVAREQRFASADAIALAPGLERSRQRAQAEPANANARREYGDLLFDAGRKAEALAEFQEAARLLPGRPEAATRAGDTLLALGRLDEAAASYGDALAADAAYAPAAVGLAWEALLRDRPAEAETRARAAGAGDEAQLVLGLSLMRQPEKLAEARRMLETASTGAGLVGAQARSWLALMLLAEGDTAGALREAKGAAAGAPGSAVARGNLALVRFYGDRPADAEKEANAALKLNPDSVAALCALGQAQLARGDVDRAVRTAARAAGLDPAQPQAHYLLGIADAQRRDYRHAARSLEESLRLAPGFLPAASALARVYTRMGRNEAATGVLEGLLPGARDADQVRLALGGVYYQQGRYQEAEGSYREALKLKPNSALAWAELARVLIDDNRLDEAITAGQRAVHLAPQVGQYHAVLGLAYDYGKLSTQAEREFRDAVALDPHNALAHLALGLRAARSDLQQRMHTAGQGLGASELLTMALQATGSSPANGAITQAFLRDPSVARQLTRGGIDGEGTVGGGNSSGQNLALQHQAMGLSGSLHSLSLGTRSRDDGWRQNTDSATTSLSETVGLTVGPRTTLLFRGAQNWRKYGLYAPAFPNDTEDRANARDGLLQISARHRMGTRGALWIGLARPEQRLSMADPTGNTSGVWVQMLPEHGGGLPQLIAQPAWRQEMRSQMLVPEARLEWALSRSARRPATLALGGTHVSIRPALSADTWNAEVRHFAAEIRLPGELDVAYAHYSQRLSDRLAFTAGLGYQRLATSALFTSSETGKLIRHPQYQPRKGEYLLPFVVANYHTGPRTGLRVLFSRQAEEGQLAPITFSPLDATLSTEPAVGLHGTPSRTRTIEVDLEHYPSGRSAAKLFVFQSFAASVRDPQVRIPIGEVTRTGAGARWDQRLSRHLFGTAGVVWNRTTNRTPYAPFDGTVAPYYPRLLADAGLSYVDGSGTRLGVQVTHTGRFYRDSGIFSERTRPLFPGRVYVDLSLVRETSPNSEYFLKVLNLFDSPTIDNEYPATKRRVAGGVTVRY